MSNDDSKQTAPEYTKTLLYVIIDLGVRVLSGVALIVIGVAGWRLQHDAQRQHLEDDRREQLSRQYLPMYRTFTDLELALQDCSDDLSVVKSGPSRLQALRDHSSQVRTAAASTFIATEEPITPIDLPVLTKSSRGALGTPTVSLKLPVRATAVMVSDVLRLLALSESSMSQQNLDAAVVEITRDKHQASALVLVPIPVKGKSDVFVLTPTVVAPGIKQESADAWQAWNGAQLVPLNRLRFFDGVISRAVCQQTIEAMQRLMHDRAELGDRFVNIRRDAVAEFVERRESRRRASSASQAEVSGAAQIRSDTSR